MKETKDIVEIDNAFSEEFCKKLIEKFDSDPRVGSYSNEYILEKGVYGRDNREASSLIISCFKEYKEEDQHLYQVITKSVEQYLEYYGIKYDMTDEGYTVVKYDIGKKCHRHVDGPYDGKFVPTRGITIIIFLNDVAVGGELHFPRQDMTIKPQTGKMVMFPPYLTHPHWVNEVVSNQRYAVVAWIQYKYESQPSQPNPQ